VLLISATIANAQLRAKQYVYDKFNEQRKYVPKVLDELSSAKAKQHPEYGYLPYNAQCTECVELIDERTEKTRTFVDPKSPNHRYNQSSFFPLHYRNNNQWITIDSRLQPVPNQPGVYTALNQPVPAVLDVNEGYSALNAGFTFKFNQGLLMYLLDGNGNKIYTGNTSLLQKTVGIDGMYVTNIWPGLDMRQTFRLNEVETDYIVPKPLQLPENAVWMVMEDHITLQDGYTIANKDLQLTGKCLIKGDLKIVNAEGIEVALVKIPTYYDNNARGTFGHYELSKTGDIYTCKMYVPVKWLNLKDNAYPLTLDPSVFNKIGAFDSQFPGQQPAAMGFTYFQLGSCDYHLGVTLPGDATITNTKVDIEYRNTYNPNCDAPDSVDALWQGCRRDDLSMEIVDSICGNTVGPLTCGANQAPIGQPDTTSGTCTSDVTLVPTAPLLLYPNLLNCIQPQCEPLEINFTLRNRSFRCPETCGYECAKGNMWMMTIEYITLAGSWTQDKTQVCAGEPVTFTSQGQFGVAPYHFRYFVTTLQGIIDTTIWGSNTFVFAPEDNIQVQCWVYDTCNSVYIDLPPLDVQVVQSPPANAGGPFYVCNGETVVIGGNPTTTAGASIQWTGETPQASSWMSNANAPNPSVTIPAGVVDTFTYRLRTQDFQCFRESEAIVISLPNPAPVIDSTGGTYICNGQSVGLVTTQPFAAYAWNNGANTAGTSVSQPGSYYVVVTDQYGCTANSNTITVTQLNVPDINVYPDTLIFYGDSVALYTDANFATADSFFWYPNITITCTDCTDPSVAPTVDRYYGLVVYDQGCVVTDSALIRVILPTNFYIPNAFTPNSDGSNDFFFIFSQSGVEVRDFKVFNRWGEKVHDSVFEWDGTYKGKPAPQGVYVYVFQLKIFGEDTDRLTKGSVTLIR
jgi:gliding motility-associated-like protein